MKKTKQKIIGVSMQTYLQSNKSSGKKDNYENECRMAWSGNWSQAAETLEDNDFSWSDYFMFSSQC